MTSANDIVADVELTGTRDGVTQLQRRWRPAPSSDGTSTARSSIVLVHGLGEHSGSYEHVGRFLAEQGHDVVAFDNRGFGQSGGRRGHVNSFDEYLDDVEDLVIERRQLGVPVVLFGHSLGGLISITYLVRGRPAPDLLVLSSPALGAVLPRWKTMAAPFLARVAPRLFVKNEFEGSILTSDPAVQATYPKDKLRVNGSTAALGHASFSAMEEASAGLDRITMPTYVLHGGDDQLVPSRFSEPLAKLPNVTRRLWPGMQHECFNEIDRAEVLKELGVWLNDQLNETS